MSHATGGGRPCPHCATERAPDGWCPGCLVTTPVTAPAVLRPVSQPRPQTLRRSSRTAASATTFGRRGRVVCTLLVVLVLPGLWLSWAPFAFNVPALLFYAVTVVPWALRDIWAAAPVLVRPPRH